MHPQCATFALGEYLEIPASLRCFDGSKGIFLVRNRQIHRIVAGDLQKHAAVRTAFIGLPGRMQEARTKAQAGSYTLTVTHRETDTLQLAFVFAVHLDVSEQSHIVTGTQLSQM